jgi:nitrate reductase gamma subunit
MQGPLDLLLFVVLPYVAAIAFAIGSIERYRRHAASVTSQSSQFLENRRHFWALMPFHLGLLAVLVAHLVWFLAPALVLRWNREPARLYAVEVAMLACGLLALSGFLMVGLRRAADARLRGVTGAWDWIVYALLLAQIAFGVIVAVGLTWGSTWFAAVGSPYLWSLVRLDPDIAAIATLPLFARAHIVTAWLLLAVFPFSRLVHILAVPNSYLWRRPQVVRWHRAAVVTTGGRR